LEHRDLELVELLSLLKMNKVPDINIEIIAYIMLLNKQESRLGRICL